MVRFRKALSRFSVPLFFLLSYGWSWGCWLLVSRIPEIYENELYGASTILTVVEIPIFTRIGFVIAFLTDTFGPAISAIILTSAIGGKASLREFFGRVVKWRVNIRYYLAVFLIPPAMVALCIGLIYLWGGTPQIDISTSSVWVAVGIFAKNFFRTGGQEELGFRGFAQQKLQTRFNLFVTSLIIGVLWFFWHLPLYLWVPEASQYGKSLLSGLLLQVGFCFMFTWVYSRTKSILMPMLLHAVINSLHGILLISVSGPNAELISWLALMVPYTALGGWLIWRDRARNRNMHTTASGYCNNQWTLTRSH